MTAPRPNHIAAVRRFNRFYAQRIVALESGGMADDGFSPTERRVIFELSQNPATTAKVLCRQLGLDAGYLSRILHRFYCDGLLLREMSLQDRREFLLDLTPAGRAASLPLDHAASRRVADLLRPLDEGEQRSLLAAMHTIMQLLAEEEGRR